MEPVYMFGAYVSDMSTSVGWGGQGGSMQLKLIEDPPHDVEIDLPPVGTPVYFKYGSFYFGGIFQRWTYAESISSGRIYDVIIDSPAKLMDGVQCILEDWNGTTDLYMADEFQQGYSSTNVPGLTVGYGRIENVYNLFGYWENPLLGGIFGGSNFNSAGVEVDTLLDALQILAWRGATHPFGGPINLKGHKFNLDVSAMQKEVANIWGSYEDAWRIKGPVKSVNGFLGEIADTIQVDYFYDIEPEAGIDGLDDGGGLIPLPIVKVKTVSKQQQPTAGAINKFIQDGLKTGTVSSYSVGQEYGYATTQKLVYGGKRTRYQVVAPVVCEPIWGKSEAGFYNIQGITPLVMGSPSKTIDISLGNDFNNAPYTCSIFEIRMALGSRSTWDAFKTFETIAGVEPNGFNNIKNSPWTGSFDCTEDVLILLQKKEGNNFDAELTNLNIARKRYLKSANDIADKIYASVAEVATNYYCQQFLVPLEGEFSSQLQMEYAPAGDFEVIKSWETADAAFIENKLASDLKFFDNIGKQKSMCGWRRRAEYDFGNLGSDYDVGLRNMAGMIVTTKGSPEGEMYWDGNNHWVCYQTGAAVKYFDDITTPDFGLTVLAKYFFDIDIQPEFYFKKGFAGGLQFAIPPDNAIPDAFGVPQQSNRYNYGPWVTLKGTYSPEGKAEVISDQGLTPETFGGYANLRNMGNITATIGTGVMSDNESGFVEVVGAPEGNIGERFAASGPYCTNISVTVNATGGVKTTYKFNTWTPNFGKLAKYNIDRISHINKSSWALAKKLRDRVTKRPVPKFRFEKMDFPSVAKLNDEIAAQISRHQQGKKVNHVGHGEHGGGVKGVKKPGKPVSGSPSGWPPGWESDDEDDPEGEE